jgi:hypothetical protein
LNEMNRAIQKKYMLFNLSLSDYCLSLLAYFLYYAMLIFLSWYFCPLLSSSVSRR